MPLTRERGGCFTSAERHGRAFVPNEMRTKLACRLFGPYAATGKHLVPLWSPVVTRFVGIVSGVTAPGANGERAILTACLTRLVVQGAVRIRELAQNAPRSQPEG